MCVCVRKVYAYVTCKSNNRERHGCTNNTNIRVTIESRRKKIRREERKSCPIYKLTSIKRIPSQLYFLLFTIANAVYSTVVKEQVNHKIFSNVL